MNIAMLLEMVSQTDPDRVAISAGESDWTYAELAEEAGRYAAQIQSSRLTSVGYLGENSAGTVALFFGCAMAGASYVPLNYRWTDDQLRSAVDQLAPMGLLADEGSSSRLSGVDGLTPLSAPPGAGHHEPAATDAEFPGVLLFTSGTSGTPKTAVLRNRHLVPYVVTTVEFLGATSDEAILVSVPPYHIAAVSSMLTSVYAGRRMVLLPTFEPEAWVRTVREQCVTQAMVVPTMLNRVLDIVEGDGQGLPSLRHLSYGGGRMPVSVIERAMSLLPGLDLVNAYGLTETSSTITLLGPEDHRIAAASDDPEVRARLGSVGTALPTVELEIRATDGTVLGPGEPGEIWVRGDQVSGEYLSHSAVDSDGWYPTRDYGQLDHGGFLFLGGRADDVIVRGGENIAPAEIEERIQHHPAVADVGVVGVADNEWGERIEAFVVPTAGAAVTESDIQSWVRDGLRSTRVPGRVHLRDQLPYNETGKLLRRELKAERTVDSDG